MKDSPALMAQFSQQTRRWFLDRFRQPTEVQAQAWQSIADGSSTLVVAPTGSGKTLSAFLWSIDRLNQSAVGDQNQVKATKVLYISPLKALGVDIEKNLRQPLQGIEIEYVKAGLQTPGITVGVRSGDTSASERRRLLTKPPDILITTPESLYLMLTSNGAETLRQVDTVIIDEIHALADDKRGAHLALSLERLDRILPRPAQRIGLSATVKPADEVARYLGGNAAVRIVAPKTAKKLITEVQVPVADMSNPEPENLVLGVGQDDSRDEHRWGSIWPSIENAIYQKVCSSTSTIVFANSRRLAERLTGALNILHKNETGDEQSGFARSHHGSVSKEQRLLVEEELKAGTLRCVVATASLELGIDMGDVQQIIQIDSPPSVSSGLQRIGRSGHQVNNASRALFFPTHPSKLLEIATICERIQQRNIESLRVLQNPLDILAQQTVAEASRGVLDVDQWYELVRRAAPFQGLPRSSYDAVLDLLSGKYPSTDFAELRPRIVWNRQDNTIEGKPSAGRLAILGGGTIPDRGLYRVEAATSDQDAGPSARIGELDEEMVHESRVGEIFILGATAWRIREITPDRVKVVPAPGRVGKMPFWRGESAYRPSELGRAIGVFTRDMDQAAQVGGQVLKKAEERLRKVGFDENAITNVFKYLAEQRNATGVVPSDQRIVVERTKDEVGDWRIILESPFGMQVHAPWALAVLSRLRELTGQDGQAQASNEGIIVTLPDSGTPPLGAELFSFDPEEIEQIVIREVSGSALFAARFRESAARALILGGGKPGKRAPLWQQRQRATRLLEVASQYKDFPIMLEAARECLQDVYDLQALQQIQREIQQRTIDVREVTTEVPSPFARSLLFGYVAEYLYQTDMPLGERRLAALNLDDSLMSQLLGKAPASMLLEPQALSDVESQLQRTSPEYRRFGKEGVTDLLRELGHLTELELTARLNGVDAPATEGEVALWCQELLEEERIVAFELSNVHYYAIVEDSGTLVVGLGIDLPSELVEIFPRHEYPLRDLLGRYFKTHGPFSARQLAARFGLTEDILIPHLRQFEGDGVLRLGRFLLDDDTNLWVEEGVLQRIKRRSAAILRAAIQPVSQAEYQRFLLDWQYCGQQLQGVDGLATAVEQLVGLPIVASALETFVLPQRVRDYRPELLDELVSTGEVIWVGEEAVGEGEGKLSLHLREDLKSTLGELPSEIEDGVVGEIVKVLRERGALFGEELRQRIVGNDGVTDSDFVEGLWSLVWAGMVTSDSLKALRSMISRKSNAHKTKRAAPRSRSVRRGSFSAIRAAAKAKAATNSAITACTVGRWSLVERSPVDPTEKLSIDASLLLDRYGVVAKGAAVVERFPGGFSETYRILAEFEQFGYCRRGNFIDGLGGAQFAAPSTVDRLRETNGKREQLIVLSAIDPALAYGAILAWPTPLDSEGALPRRNPGALVILAGGKPIFYLERGGKTALSFGAVEDQVMRVAAQELFAACNRARVESFTLELIDGQVASRSAWYSQLGSAGFSLVPRGLAYSQSI